jgi:hypothetical protein
VYAPTRGETIPDEDIIKVAPIVENPEFTPEFMQSKSAAAANLCTYVHTSHTHHREQRDERHEADDFQWGERRPTDHLMPCIFLVRYGREAALLTCCLHLISSLLYMCLGL